MVISIYNPFYFFIFFISTIGISPSGKYLPILFLFLSTTKSIIFAIPEKLITVLPLAAAP